MACKINILIPPTPLKKGGFLEFCILFYYIACIEIGIKALLSNP